MRLLRILAALALAAGLSSIAVTQAHADQYPCVGAPADEPNGGLYAEPRVFAEGQAQWVPGPGQVDNSATNNGHEHVGACIPERETLTGGNLTIPVRVIMFNNPGSVTQVSMVFKGTDYEITVQEIRFPTFTCPVGECVKWVSFSWPVSAFNHSGLQEVRFRSGASEANSKEMKVSLNWQLYIQNGKPLANVTREPWLRGKGWYTHSLYCEGTFVSVPVPDAPVSGVWSPVVKMDTHSTDASLPVTHYTAAIDPHGHLSPPDPGIVLLDADGRWPAAPVSIDTTTLANGTHRLFLKSGCRDDTLGSTNWGVVVVPFVVAN